MLNQGRWPEPATRERSGGHAGVEDAVLVARARVDPGAFTPLYARYADPIYRYCYRRLGDVAAAEDATSQVFLKALAALPNYRDGSFRSWLFTIAYTVIADSFRARRPHYPLDDAPEPIDPAPTPEEAALAGESRHSVQTLLGHLSEEQRRVVELRLAGLTGVEIAHVTGRSHGAVRALQFRAAAKLREIIQAGTHPGGTR